MTDTAERIKDLFARELQIDKARMVDNAEFKFDLGMDSVDMIEMILSLEKEFVIPIADEEMQDLVTVRDLIGFMENKLADTA